MFTGIVQAVGRISAVRAQAGDRALTIDAQDLSLEGLKAGDSIAVAGVCLTITALAAGEFQVDVSAETLACTTLGALAAGSAVNLERALRVGEALGGHLVTGHVDAVATVLERSSEGRSERVWFAAPPELARYLARKGSVCLDGVSLTINEAQEARFVVNLIPHTLHATTLHALRPGARVNLEVDLLARYLERLRPSA